MTRSKLTQGYAHGIASVVYPVTLLRLTEPRSAQCFNGPTNKIESCRVSFQIHTAERDLSNLT
jgi:hypothetical protein